MIFLGGVPIFENGARIKGIHCNRRNFRVFCKSAGGSGGSLGSRYVWKKFEKNIHVYTPPETPGTPLPTRKNTENSIKKLNGAHRSLRIVARLTPLFSSAEVGRQNPANRTTPTAAANLNHESGIIGALS